MDETYQEGDIVIIKADEDLPEHLFRVTKNNVFGIQTGVAISFMVRNPNLQGCTIHYTRRPEFETAEDKLAWLGQTKASQITYDRVAPDATTNCINLTENEWETLLPIATKSTKAAKVKGQEQAIFKFFSLGVVTARDDWVYDFDLGSLNGKVTALINAYNADVAKRLHATRRGDEFERDEDVKWSRAVKRDLEAAEKYDFSDGVIVRSDYRPFVRKHTYFSPKLNEMIHQTHRFAGPERSVPYIASVFGSSLVD